MLFTGVSVSDGLSESCGLRPDLAPDDRCLGVRLLRTELRPVEDPTVWIHGQVQHGRRGCVHRPLAGSGGGCRRRTWRHAAPPGGAHGVQPRPPCARFHPPSRGSHSQAHHSRPRANVKGGKLLLLTSQFISVLSLVSAYSDYWLLI